MTSTSSPRLARAAATALAKADDARAEPQSAARDETIAAIKGALRQRSAKRRNARLTKGGVALAAAAAVALIVGWKRPAHETAAVQPPAAATAATAPDVRAVTAERVTGEVVVADGDVRTPLAAGKAIDFGRRIVASDGTARLALPSGTHLDVERTTDVVVAQESRAQIIRLGTGAVTSTVAKVAPGDRFLVRTGDVEVEVRGTIFRVERRPDPTCGFVTKVDVTEGRVAVRAPGEDEHLLTPGQSWASQCAPATSATPPVGDHEARRAARAAKTSAAPKAAPEVVAPAPAAPPIPASELAAQNALFRDAMNAKSRGDARGAVAILDTFLARYPNSPLEEGAAAQRMRLLATFDGARASAAAKDYLARYPNGFAREDADKIVRGVP